MTSTVLVLVMMPISGLLTWIIALAATSRLAKRNGQALKSMSLSIRHGITAEFFKPTNSERNTS
ncbi:MAG: hypothetical protein ACLP2J_12060 [Acidimicrobiales bacterium]